MQGTTTTINFSFTEPILVDLLWNKQQHLFLLKNTLSQEKASKLAGALKNPATFDGVRLDLPDGYFSPLPYSTVHNEINSPKGSWTDYLRIAEAFQKQTDFLQPIIREVEKTVQHIFGAEVLRDASGKPFAPLGFRVLTAGKNGIDIHCENAFLHQLEPSFREWFYECIDIENIISFFTILQPANEGGELLLFDESWQNAPIKLSETTYEERHDIGGSLFTNHGYARPEHTRILPQTGDSVIFRAAQLWHAIGAIGHEQQRITVGCFVGQGKDGKNYYWS